LGQEAAS
jgi:hypothetical protein